MADAYEDVYYVCVAYFKFKRFWGIIYLHRIPFVYCIVLFKQMLKLYVTILKFEARISRACVKISFLSQCIYWNCDSVEHMRARIVCENKLGRNARLEYRLVF